LVIPKNFEVDLSNNCTPRHKENFTSMALVRGIGSRIERVGVPELGVSTAVLMVECRRFGFEHLQNHSKF